MRTEFTAYFRAYGERMLNVSGPQIEARLNMFLKPPDKPCLIEGCGKESKSRSRMGNETKTNGAANMAGGGGFRAKMEHYVYSGDKKHVMAGIGIFTLIFGVPWYLMTRGSKQQSHQDYMDKADKARKARLSSSPSSN